MEIRQCAGYYVCCNGKCEECIEAKTTIASCAELDKRDAFHPGQSYTLDEIIGGANGHQPD